ncbi:MAG: hypothetical protein R3B72_41455 [Polyangiaceae bacterium]
MPYRTLRPLSALGLGLAITAAATSAEAQDALDLSKDAEVEEAPEGVLEDKEDGVDWRINAGATLNLSDNRSVVGQTEGSTLGFGFKFESGLDWRKEAHELRNSLGIAAGVTRTPAVPEFVKTQDNLEVESIYLYHILDWFGAYGRVAWQTPMFRGTDVRGEPVDYQINNLDGTSTTVAGASRLTLTDALHPSRFKQSLGLFAQPVAKEPINVETRVGAAGRETLAHGQLALADDDGTPQIEVNTLDDVFQLGGEGTLEVWGSFSNKKVNYKAGAEVMIPFLNNADDGRSALELTNVLLYGSLGFKLVDWASLDYQLRAVREPQLLDAWQVQNQLLLTLGIAAGSASPEEE